MVLPCARQGYACITALVESELKIAAVLQSYLKRANFSSFSGLKQTKPSHLAQLVRPSYLACVLPRYPPPVAPLPPSWLSRSSLTPKAAPALESCYLLKTAALLPGHLQQCPLEAVFPFCRNMLCSTPRFCVTIPCPHFSLQDPLVLGHYPGMV